MPCAGYRRSSRPAFRNSSAAPRASRPTCAITWARATELENCFVAAGLNSIGLQSAGGIGKVVVGVDPRRAPADRSVGGRRTAQHAVPDQSQIPAGASSESLGLLYATHWPFRQYETARGVRKSALHDRLARGRRLLRRGLRLGARQLVCARRASSPNIEYSYGRQNWFEHSAREHRAVREAVGLFDQSSFAKFRLEGADAERVLNRVCANDVAVRARQDGLHPVAERARRYRGGPHGDAPGRDGVSDRDRGGNRDQGFQLAAAPHRQPGALRVDQCHLRHGRLVRDGAACAGVAAVAHAGRPVGPRHSRSRPAGRSNWGMRWCAPRASPMSGSSAGSSTCPPNSCTASTTSSIEAGARHGLVHAGYHALNSLRIEKAYRHLGHDISDEDTPLEAGLGFAVKFDKPGGFIGREALLRQKRIGIAKRLLQFQLRSSRTAALSQRADLARRLDRRLHSLRNVRPYARRGGRAGLR